MLVQYRKDYEKIAMGLLSYLPDFSNLNNLKEEIKLNEKTDNDFQLYLFRNQEGNMVGVIGTQVDDHFVVIRYLSLAPGFREEKYQRRILRELQENFPKQRITAIPEYTYLIKLLDEKNERK